MAVSQTSLGRGGTTTVCAVRTRTSTIHATIAKSTRASGATIARFATTN